MNDQFEVDPEDDDLMAEIELMTKLIVAAGDSDRHLTTMEIDGILGVRPPGPRPEA